MTLYHRFLKIISLILLGFVLNPSSKALGAGAQSIQSLKRKTEQAVKNKATPLLKQYCQDSCQIIDIEVFVLESVPEVDELGFESVNKISTQTEYFVDNVILNVQVDKRITQSNVDKLKSILLNHLRSFGTAIQVNLQSVALPYIGQSASLAENLRRKVKVRLESAVKRTIQRFCPNDCILSSIYVDGLLITPDEAGQFPSKEIVYSESNHTVMHLQKILIDLTMDEALKQEERSSIEKVIQAETSFVKPVEIAISLSRFPKSFEDKRFEREREAADPYGLEKLRQMLTMFRELAGTKEIITTSKSDSTQSSSSNSSLEKNSEKSASQASSISSEDTKNNFSEGNWFVYALVLLGVLGLIFVLVVKLNKANQDARVMVSGYGQAENQSGSNSREEDQSGERQGGAKRIDSQEIRDKFQLEDLKDELVQTFLDAPKVAKETFTRILQEEGVEATAKYLHIFGKLVIFELLADPNLQRNLYELSEYYHKSKYEFEVLEEIDLLKSLKTKVTANEIMVLAKKSIDQFEFLSKLESSKIFDLLSDEKPQVQSIILTQVTPKKRREIFDMFEGKAKSQVLRELCKADAIPREYLYNVAVALSKKVSSKPEFDTQSLRANDIILELLEKASLTEQKILMKSLKDGNQDGAKAIKLKLVTIETLSYLKDGHLLELVLGLEREALLNFLGGAPNHIRELLLSHAPEELADSWREDLETMVSVDEAIYRKEEIKIIGKIRQLASNGVISLLEINELIFASIDEVESLAIGDESGLQNSNLVA